jgi:hypothetical protein
MLIRYYHRHQRHGHRHGTRVSTTTPRIARFTLLASADVRVMRTRSVASGPCCESSFNSLSPADNSADRRSRDAHTPCNHTAYGTRPWFTDNVDVECLLGVVLAPLRSQRFPHPLRKSTRTSQRNQRHERPDRTTILLRAGYSGGGRSVDHQDRQPDGVDAGTTLTYDRRPMPHLPPRSC